MLIELDDLFDWAGIRSIGVDRIAGDAGVAPTTLCRLFASKGDLISAYVERADARYRQWFLTATTAAGRNPRERVPSLFGALADQVQPERCRGCPFLTALAEFPDVDLPTHRHAVATTAWLRARFAEF